MSHMNREIGKTPTAGGNDASGDRTVKGTPPVNPAPPEPTPEPAAEPVAEAVKADPEDQKAPSPAE